MGEQDYISKTYKALKDNLQGFSKTEDEFRQNLISDPAYRTKVHTALSENLDGFSRTPEEFDSLVGVKKKALQYPLPRHRLAKMAPLRSLQSLSLIIPWCRTLWGGLMNN